MLGIIMTIAGAYTNAQMIFLLKSPEFFNVDAGVIGDTTS